MTDEAASADQVSGTQDGAVPHEGQQPDRGRHGGQRRDKNQLHPKELGHDGITPLVDADRALRVREIGTPSPAMVARARSAASQQVNSVARKPHAGGHSR
jgi:hypothetical protein